VSDINAEVQELAQQCEPPLTLGSCVLKRPELAQLVQDAIRHFECQRYYLLAWCVMPNHVHVVFSTLGQWTLSQVLHSWKSFRANQINKILGRRGPLWERESFDHLIRSIEHCDWYVDYVQRNPVVAGLCLQPADWPVGSAAA
jgi:REP element-mobilizing transposase RayT